MATNESNKGQLSCALCPPYSVYRDGVEVSVHQTAELALTECNKLWLQDMTPIQRQRERDRSRTALQTPIAAPRYRVMYMHGRQERKTAWFHSVARADKALAIVRARVGATNAITYMD